MHVNLGPLIGNSPISSRRQTFRATRDQFPIQNIPFAYAEIFSDVNGMSMKF